MDWTIYVARTRGHWNYLRKVLQLGHNGCCTQARVMVTVPGDALPAYQAGGVIISAELHDQLRTLPLQPTPEQQSHHEWWAINMLHRMTPETKLIII